MWVNGMWDLIADKDRFRLESINISRWVSLFLAKMLVLKHCTRIIYKMMEMTELNELEIPQFL